MAVQASPSLKETRTGIASAAGSDTKVTIKGENGDYYGYVKSQTPTVRPSARGRCSSSSAQDPRNDMKIGSDTSESSGTRAMWSIGNSGCKSGKFYAKAAKVSAPLQAATSATISR